MDEGDSALCTYVFDPEIREAATGPSSSLSDELLNEDGVWSCPHTAADGHDQCVFHLSPDRTDDVEVRDRLLARIAEPGRRPKQFIGASFGHLDLAYEVIESVDNHPIDVRHAEFTEPTTWEYTIVRQPLNLEGATFHEQADFMETRFHNEAYLSGVTFEAEARFFDTKFTQGGWFYQVTFATANFHRSTFGGHADFIDARFEQCHFREAVFEGRVHFDKGTFEHASFQGVRFEDDAYFDEVSFPERVSFQYSHFAAVGSFTEIDPIVDSCCIDLRNTTVTRGALVPASGGTVVYDLKDATVGDLEITDDTTSSDLFTYFRFQNTTFDGFDFGAYRDVLNAADWTIHEATSVSGLEEDDDLAPSFGELESTYLKAKNGANAIGDTKAAAEFFRKEMLYRRYQYIPVLRSRDHDATRRVVAAWRWAANKLLNLTSGYGERPSRVVVASVGIVVLFTGLFTVATPVQPYDSPAGPLVLSLESFITLVLGGAEPIRNPWIRLLAQVEGFVGAFLIALFVFTLTRSIHR